MDGVIVDHSVSTDEVLVRFSAGQSYGEAWRDEVQRDMNGKTRWIQTTDCSEWFLK